MATNDIDDSLYSRQRYVLGDSAMKRLAGSSVLVVGVGGLGVEIAKNIILAGVKSMTIQDSQTTTVDDLATQFFLRDEDVKNGTNRASACVDRLAELNPYVSVNTLTTALTEDSDLSYLNDFQCIVLTQASLDVQLKVNTFCREQTPNIKFVVADVYGVFCWTFCDFGDEFEVVDVNGEEPKEVFVGQISKGAPGVVTTLDDQIHGLEDGDTVLFREVKGMTALNGLTCNIKSLTPYQFSICNTTDDKFKPHENGGIVTQIKTPVKKTFQNLQQQLPCPTALLPDLSKLDTPLNVHLAMIALHNYKKSHGRLPQVGDTSDAEELVKLANTVNDTMTNKVDPVDAGLVHDLARCCRGCFAPLCAALGGIVAQEALKALTGKFTPLNQWLHLEAREVLSANNDCLPRNDRYDALRACVGESLRETMSNLKLFMVGCGAIGCEMLKNYALLGLASSPQGKITITDNDLIEKSNLNRQFLFRPRHIRKPKSTTAAASTLEINPALQIEAQQHKVCPQTEEKVYPDAFFESQHLIVNALDNLEARRYVDGRCVTNQRPLLESGTMGPRGHVQVIVPHLSESYTSQRDPVDNDVPYCTLKSFPAVIEHCIQWARDKFESSFVQKPQMFNKFWSVHTQPLSIIQQMESGNSIDGAIQISRLAHCRPTTWAACVALGKIKFQKYFVSRAKQLLHAFPLETKLKDGSPFWQSPKRPPDPCHFSVDNPLHMQFVKACARLYADVAKVPYTAQDCTADCVAKLLQGVTVPEFKVLTKHIEVDESAKKPETVELSVDDIQEAANHLRAVVSTGMADKVFSPLQSLEFEKDEDSNGHIDFITAAANLRAAMYKIEEADRLKVKRIAGRIIPAIATTTAAVAGLVAVEMVKLLKQVPLDQYRNTFLNLAIPVMVPSEPGPTVTTKLSNGLSYTPWDRWEVSGSKTFTLKQFLQYFKDKYKLKVSLVVHGVKMIYVPIMPAHKKRIPQAMVSLLKPSEGTRYVDLVMSYENPDGVDEDDQMGPPVRYFIGR